MTKKIAIIGGGVNGVFASYMLSKKGFHIDLFEKNTLMSQTSSSSSKLLHGGIRYLENLEFFLVRQSLIDRHWWLKNAPDFCKKVQIHIPVNKDSSRNIFMLYVGSKIYQYLAGKKSLGPSRRINDLKINKNFQELKIDNIKAMISFYDLQMDESGLSNWLINKAKKNGVEVYENHEIKSFRASGELIKSNSVINYDLIINAAGPWAYDLNCKNNINTKYSLELIKGSHLLLNKKIENSYLFQVPGESRVVFIMPYKRNTLIGTTESHYKIGDKIACDNSERDYLLSIYNNFFKNQVDVNDIDRSFSGIRPIVKSINKSIYDYSSASRESKIELIEKMITVYGGKWTSAPSLSLKLIKVVDNFFKNIH